MNSSKALPLKKERYWVPEPVLSKASPELRSRAEGLAERSILSRVERSEDPRVLAFRILLQVEEKGAFADLLLGERLGQSHLSVQDKALLTRLVYGTLAWQLRLDWTLSLLCRTPLERLDLEVKILLRLALYQLLFLSRVPSYAVVDTAVRLAKRIRREASGLINAILRRAAREKDRLLLPDKAKDPIRYLAVLCSHPSWLVKKWIEELGEEETRALLEANNSKAPTTLRVNQLKTNREALITEMEKEGVAAKASSFSPLGVTVAGANPNELPGFSQGKFSAQGEASQLIPLLLEPQAGERVLDACAAPGGKTAEIAELMGNQGEIVALDIHPLGLTKVKENAQRLGLTIVHPQKKDASLISCRNFALPFDRILVDVPCSGLGTLRSHPEIRWRLREENVKNLAALQLKILQGVASLLKPAGILIYATCTLTNEENPEIIGHFLKAHPEFSMEPPSLPLLQDFLDSQGFFRTFPHRQGLDGFFAARLRRNA